MRRPLLLLALLLALARGQAVAPAFYQAVNVTKIVYTPAAPADWPGSPPTQAAAALDGLATLVSFSPLCSFYVDLNGNDISGLGTFLSPWRTIAHSVAQIDGLSGCGAAGASLQIGGGTWTESWTGSVTPLTYSGGPSVAGGGPSTSGIFTPSASIFTMVGFSFTAAQSWVLNNTAYLTGMYCGNLNLSSGSGTAQTVVLQASTVGGAFASSGVIVLGFSSSFLGSLSSTSTTYATAISLYFSRYNTVTINGPAHFSELFLYLSYGVNVTASGPLATVFAATPGAFNLLTLLSGAPAPVFLNGAQTVGYSPATSANWLTVPAVVGAALDQLAAHSVSKVANSGSGTPCSLAGPTLTCASSPTFTAPKAATHFLQGGAVPTLSSVGGSGSALGVGGACSITGNDANFFLSCTSGTSPSGSGSALATLTFAVPWESGATPVCHVRCWSTYCISTAGAELPIYQVSGSSASVLLWLDPKSPALPASQAGILWSGSCADAG